MTIKLPEVGKRYRQKGEGREKFLIEVIDVRKNKGGHWSVAYYHGKEVYPYQYFLKDFWDNFEELPEEPIKPRLPEVGKRYAHKIGKGRGIVERTHPNTATDGTEYTIIDLRYDTGGLAKVPSDFFWEYFEELPEKNITNSQEMKQENKWQPIETAPKDGTEILLWCKNGEPFEEEGACYVARYQNQGRKGWQTIAGLYLEIDDIDPDDSVYPTHWMHLPNSPKMKQENPNLQEKAAKEKCPSCSGKSKPIKTLVGEDGFQCEECGLVYSSGFSFNLQEEPEVQAPTPEIIRSIVRRIKKLSSVRDPEYQLPADSFIEEAARDIASEILSTTITEESLEVERALEELKYHLQIEIYHDEVSRTWLCILEPHQPSLPAVPMPGSGWRSIETCERESTNAEEPVLLFTKKGQIVEGYWTQNGNEWIAMLYDSLTYRDIIFNGFSPTHWMPLPPPPTNKGE